jgi:hypothetical protein
MKKEVTLVKNCIATIIPAGDEITLAEGAQFVIAQSLGGSVTLRDENGMYRVGEGQLSALGDDIVSDVVAAESCPSPTRYMPFSSRSVPEPPNDCAITN